MLQSLGLTIFSVLYLEIKQRCCGCKHLGLLVNFCLCFRQLGDYTEMSFTRRVRDLGYNDLQVEFKKRFSKCSFRTP